MRTALSRSSLQAWYDRNEAASKKPEETPDPNPDGVYWQGGAQALQFMLKETIGAEQYREWTELVWPDDATPTWRDMYQQLDRALDSVYSGVDGVQNWADAALYPDNGNPYGLQAEM